MRNHRLFPLAIAFALGGAWLAIEFGDAALANRTSGGADTLQRMVRALPWQLAFFGLLGLPALLLGLRPVAAGSLVLALATFVLLLARLLEGLLKRGLGSLEGLAWIAGALALAAAPAAVVWLRRLLPGRWRAGVAPAIWLGWMLCFVPALQRVAPTLAFAVLPSAEATLDARELAFAAVVVAALIVVGAAPRLWPVAALVLVSPAAWLLGPSEPFPARSAVAASRPDVIVVVIDTLRADHLAPASAAALAPNLAALLAESIRFERAYSPANTTLTAMPGVMTSLPSTSVGQGVSPDAHTLAEHLRDAGYATVGLSANPLVSERTGYAQGFDRFSDSADWPSYQVGDLRRILGVLWPGLAYRTGISSSEFYYRPVSDLGRRAFALLLEAPRPSFVYLHTMDMHGPYLPPRDLLSPDHRDADFLSYFEFLRVDRARVLAPDAELGAGIENLRQRYAGELRFTDEHLGRLLRSLREAGRHDEALIWLLSDHGESFGERGYAGHGGTNTTSSVLRVPLALKPPRSWGLSPRAIVEPVSTYDLLPTTLSLLGLPAPALAAGSDLGPALRGEASVRALPVVAMGSGGDYGVRAGFTGPWQLDLHLAPDESIEGRRLYNVVTDPEQRVDFARAHPDVVADLEREILRFMEFETRARVETWQRHFDDQTREQLRRLGYLE